MDLHVNGAPWPFPTPTGAGDAPPPTVRDVVAAFTGSPDAPGLAVARNGEVVPRSRWAQEPVAAGDEIEIAAPFQGG